MPVTDVVVDADRGLVLDLLRGRLLPPRLAAVASGAALELRGVTRLFGALAALTDVTITVRPGERRAVLGSNGAGKTTLFNCVTGDFLPSSGTIRFFGEDITRFPPYERIRRGLRRTYQISALFPGLTVRDNVRVALQRPLRNSFQFWRSDSVLDQLNDRALALIEAVGLAPYAGLPAVELPYGRKRALEIATTLALEPEMLLLDEPMAGLAHEDIDRIAQLIRKVAADRTVLMVEHNMSVVADLSDTITVLARGEKLAEGPYAEVSKHPQVIEAYVGTGHG